MFRKNDQHRQTSMFNGINALPNELVARLKASWAGTFYREIFVRIDEELFATLYSGKGSRPNTPVNVLVGLEILKSGFGWSDEEMYGHFCYDIRVRYALGYRDLGEGHFELRTLYNFRRRVTQYMELTGENLIGNVFEQITDEQIAAFVLQADKLRMDSTIIASNIRKMSRLQLLVEVLHRVDSMLEETDQQRFGEALEPYLRGSPGQYVYRLKGKEVTEHLQRIGALMNCLVDDLASDYGREPAYRVLQRAFQEHFHIDDASLRPKEGKRPSASS